jgi:hypothetical protein
MGRPLWREDGSVGCSCCFLWTGSRGTHDYILLSNLRLSQLEGTGSCIYFLQIQSNPCVTQGIISRLEPLGNTVYHSSIVVSLTYSLAMAAVSLPNDGCVCHNIIPTYVLFCQESLSFRFSYQIFACYTCINLIHISFIALKTFRTNINYEALYEAETETSSIDWAELCRYHLKTETESSFWNVVF